MKFLKVTLAVILCVSLASCGTSAKTSGLRASANDPTTTSLPSDVPTPDWNKPFPDGVLVPPQAVPTAASEMPFGVVTPSRLDGLMGTYERRGPDQAHRAMGYVFQSAKYGRLILTENRAEMTQAQLESLLDHQNDPGSQANLSLVSIHGGAERALIIGPKSGSGVNSIEWLEGSVEFVLIGPAPAFTDQMAVEVANLL